MSLDFQAAVNAAQAVVNQSENGGSENKTYKYPLVYPAAGSTITVRLLFNPASGQIVRLVNRHEKVPCYRSYGIDCPICKVQQQVKDMTGQDPFGRTKASRSRGIAFAQYVSSSAPIDKGNNRGTLQPGEIILFMFPWSVYQQISTTIQAISQTPTGMDQAFSHASTGLFVQVSVTTEFQYTTTPVPYLSYAMTKADGSPMSDDEFINMISEMESLSEQVIPSSITEEVDKQVKEYADAINRQYITPKVANQGVPQGTAPVNYSVPPAPIPNPVQTPVNITQTGTPNYYPPSSTAIPTTPGSVYQPNTPPWEGPSQIQTPAVPQTATTPACFGRHQPGTPNCIVCPEELNCQNKTGSGG